jgi:O-methyltransferase
MFDSWQGLPKAGEHDGDGSKVWAGEAVGSSNRVLSVMRRLGIDERRLAFHKGWFEETFPRASIEQIALLHIDADFYESVKLCLTTWYPKMMSGGYIQIDDYAAFVGCRRAVDEFLRQHPQLTLEATGDLDQAFYIRIP